MASIHRESVMMKYEGQSGEGEFTATESYHHISSSLDGQDDDSSQLSKSSLDQTGSFHRKLAQSPPPLEPTPPPPDWSSAKAVVGQPPGSSESGLTRGNSNKSNCSSVIASMDETTMGKDMATIVSLLHPPQSGSPKVKRGPGRPRKDSLGVGKIHRLPSGQKIKNFMGGVRGRKKANLENSVGGSNVGLFNSGDTSVGESPPRGTDDTAESDTSSVASSLEKAHEDYVLFPEMWPGKVCGFCSLGERSMLGQGDLLRLEISAGFDPVAVSKGLTPKCRNEKDSAIDKCQKPGLFGRRQKGSAKMKRLVSQSSLESMNEPVDEVCGYADEPEYSSIFDSVGGFYFVHSNCALWCDGVEKSPQNVFQNLERELVRALNQRCQHCGNLGGGLACKVGGCDVLLHFPCASLSGAFQDSTSRGVVCSSHIESSQSSLVAKIANCTVCDKRGELSSLIMCSSCGRHYHGTCMALNCDPAIRAGWQCPACKVCQACRQPGDESKLLACDTCDKAYHIFCLRPALSSIPKHSWKCKMCRICTDCGARTPGSGPSSRWHANFSVCDSCYQQRNKGLACPLCGKAYRHVAQKLMLQCNLCKKYVHGSCDSAADLATYQQRKELYPDYEYICIPCKAAGTGLNTQGGNPRVLSALKRSEKEEQEDGVSNNFPTAHDSLLSVEDDSLPGTESSNDLMWLDKTPNTSVEDTKLPLLQPAIKDKQWSLEKLKKKASMPLKIKGTEKIGQITSNNNGRKGRMNEFGKKRGPKPKLRIFGNARVGMSRNAADVFNKSDDEPGVENRMVLCSAQDEFVLHQDVCVMCGAFGSDLEGRLIACAQCGQCYHPYCVNVKVTKVVLAKGWRCLDCTVCEGCGQRNDESRLILCDECDVSFHIYCIDPPLEQVPHGTWKCKWCAVCQDCGSNDPGLNSSWHDNYTKCGPCASQNLCPVCSNVYVEGDLIIKCFHCERWLHSQCDMIKDTNDAEKCSEAGYFCILCRPKDSPPPHLRPPPKITLPKLEAPPKSPDPPSKTGSQFLLDGIYLSESGVNHIKSLTMELPKKKRKKATNIADMEAGILAAIESVVAGGDDSAQGKNSKEENGEKDKDAKKRQRSTQKLGIGGFVARMRGPRYKEEDNDANVEQQNGPAEGDKPKRKPARRKNKNKLIEVFPSYLQEAFFGRALMDPTKETDLSTIDDLEVDTITSLKVENTIKLSKEEIQEIEAMKLRQNLAENKSNTSSSPHSEKKANKDTKDAEKLSKPPSTVEGNDPASINNILPMSGDLLGHDLVNTIIGESGTIKVEDGTEEARRGPPNRVTELQMDRSSDEMSHKDDITDFLSSQYLESMESGLPSMDSKDVEDIFKGVLVEESQGSPYSINTAAPPTPQPNSSCAVAPAATSVTNSTSTLPSSLMQSTSQGSPNIARTTTVQQNLASPVNFPPPSPYHSDFSNSPQFSPAFSEPPSPWPAAPAEDTDQPSSYNQRSILKWEADEGLGHNATISAVLYANIHHPELKRDYPNWAERAKQISKIWRGLPTDKRAPFLQKARENRAACRMHKAQQDQEKLIPPKNPRVETQEERHWKQMQALRQQHSQQHMPVPEAAKDNLANANVNVGAGGAHSHVPFSPGAASPGVSMAQRNVASDGAPVSHTPDGIRQPLQVATPHDQKLNQVPSSPLSSRMPVPVSLQQLRPISSTAEMPPPVPAAAYVQRSNLPSPQVLRSPLYTRVPFIHSPRPPTPSPNEGYGSIQSNEPSISQMQMRAFNESDGLVSSDSGHYSQPSNCVGHESGDMASGNRPSPSPQGQETRQHLRDLLQRQHVKKHEQDQISPTNPDVVQGPQRSVWGHDDGAQVVRHTLGGMSPGHMHVNHFRQPFLPTHIRMPTNNTNPVSGAQAISRPSEFRMQISQPQSSPQGADVRARMMMNQQRSLMGMTGIRQQQVFHNSTPNQFQQLRNPIDPYGHLVLQQQRMQGGGIVTSSSSMLAQQLGRPLNTQSTIGNQPVSEPMPSPVPQQQIMQPSPSQQQSSTIAETTTSLTSPMHVDHQELPDSVTAELEKLEQEQHNENNPEGEAGELADLGMDDDELLGMGADFNILEYADPELDQAVGGEKTNILDTLDLEEEDKEENKEQKRKEESESRGSKKEGVEYSSTGKPLKSSDSPKTPDTIPSQTNAGLSSPTTNYNNHGTGALEGGVSAILRPAQPPPPPYPLPPPPYPGTTQMGIRNSCGVGVNVSPGMSVGLGLKSSIGGFLSGGRLPLQQLSSPAMHSNSNPHLSLHQRRTLLLQEQPLLLEDLLEQEKQEQLRQGSGLIGSAPEEPLLSDSDFERLKAEVNSSLNMSSSLSPPNVVGHNVIPMSSQQSAILNRNTSTPSSDWPMENEGNIRRPDGLHMNSNVRPPNIQGGSPVVVNAPTTVAPRVANFTLQSHPPPPLPPEHPATEQERQMQVAYEQWLYTHQHNLQSHLQCYEGEVHKLRKVKKSLNSKQRQLRKNGNELNETDQAELDRIAKELPGLQKQLDQARKLLRQHNLAAQDYRTKQQKRQQMMGMSPGAQGSGGPQSNLSSQASPMGPTSSSPLHSTPQSPMLSPSPSMGGPSPSPLMQHSPMASPLTPSPGPAASSLSQTSPRGNMNTGVHVLEDLQYSPSDGSNRSLGSQNSGAAGRMPMQHHVSQLRMGAQGMSGHQIMISQSGAMSVVNSGVNSGLMMARGLNPSMIQLQQQRPMMDGQSALHRMRALGQQDQMRNMSPMGQRFQRIGMNQELMMRARPPPNFSSPPQMAMSPGGQHYNPSRVPFPSQSPTGSNMNQGSLRSPSPMTPMGGLGSPTNQMMMAQSRVSPASSPMRRPSGSGSIGNASPMAERPQSVENPLTPRTAGSRPHTPSNAGNLNCQNVDGMPVQLQQHSGPMENHHNYNPENCGMNNLASPPSHNMHNFLVNQNEYVPNVSHSSTEYTSSNIGGGGGGSNPQILPFPTFSWFDGSCKLGLKGGNPFSVVTEHTPSTSNPVSEQNVPVPSGQNLSQSSSSQETVPSTDGVVASESSTSIQQNAYSHTTQSSSETEKNALLNCSSNQPCQNSVSAAKVNNEAQKDYNAAGNSTHSTSISLKELPSKESQSTTTIGEACISSKEDQAVSTAVKINSEKQPVVPPESKTLPDQPSQSSASSTNFREVPGSSKDLPKVVQSDEKSHSTNLPVNHTENSTAKETKIILLRPTSNVVTTSSSVNFSKVELKTANIVSATAGGTTPVPEMLAKNHLAVVLSAEQKAGIATGHSNNTNQRENIPKAAINVTDSLQLPSSFKSVNTWEVSRNSSPAQLTPLQIKSVVAAASQPTSNVTAILLTSRTSVGNVGAENSILTSNRLLDTPGAVAELALSKPSLKSRVPMYSSSTASPHPTATVVFSNVSKGMSLADNVISTSAPLASQFLVKNAPAASMNTISTKLNSVPMSNSSVQGNIIAMSNSSGQGNIIAMSNSSGQGNIIAIKSEDPNMLMSRSGPNSIASMVTCSQLPISTSSIMHTILAQPNRAGSLQISSHPSGSFIATTSSTGSVSFTQVHNTSSGESQNALLKQLLQNTGCASTAQTSENVGFSLSSCLQSRPANTLLHTSHLSEAATRIPQPTPAIRPPRPSIPTSAPIRLPIKTEYIEELQPRTPAPRAIEDELRWQSPADEPPVTPTISTLENPVNLPVFSNETKNPLPAEIEQMETVPQETPTTKVADAKKIDDEAKKAKRRQYQSKRKQNSGKEAAAVPKKRPRKAGKPEEDFDAFIDNFMTTLRQLPPVGVVEPDLGLTYNTCAVFGCGDFSKLNTKGYCTRFGDMIGAFGQCKASSQSDYYNTKPFGKETPIPPEKTPLAHRGFYNQEFASPRMPSLGDKPHQENRTPTPLRESDTPDTIVSSSSPECSLRESPDMFVGLKLVETDEDKKIHLRDSPTMPIAYPIPIRPLLAAKLSKASNEANKENSFSNDIITAKARSLGPLKENGNITVTMTLSSAEDIRGVLRNLANILSIATPAYQVDEKACYPTDRKFYTYKTKDGKEAVDIQSILNGTAKFCKHCDVLVVDNIITKQATDLPGMTPELMESCDEYHFCSSGCYVQFSITHGVAVVSQDKHAATVVKHINDTKVEVKQEKGLSKDNRNASGPNDLPPPPPKKPSSVSKIERSQLANNKRPASENMEKDENDPSQPPIKKWKSIRYRQWTPSIPSPVKYKKPTEKEMTEMLFRLGITVTPSKIPEDSRKCIFCHQVGDGVSDGPGRLLNFDVDKWVHLNCALWSEEVYETENGALVNVEVALKQSLTLSCIVCKQSGASVKCFKVRCTSVYHVGCAVKDGCAFYKNKSVYCPVHIPKGEKENELTSLSVFRRVYVQRDENRQVAAVMHHADQHHLLRVGSLIFLSVGQLLPHQLQAFHTHNYIYPIGYKIVRFYWSMTKSNKRCQYICSIHEVDGKPEFRITAQEEGCKENVIKADSAQCAWYQVLEAVSKIRNSHDSIKVFPKYITGEDLFGLTEPAIMKVLESLPGIETLTDYNFKYGRNPLLELPLAINPSGCARAEPKLRTHFKRSHTQRTGASRASLPTSVLSSSEAACPYSKQFVHSKSSQYKKMKQEWRNNVYLARSKIQGLGLYAARDIEKHTMVIEYIGEIIRNELAELREKKYESQNRGIYMFRMDDERVIDATLCGGLARYINHSCNPNCVAETVEVDRDLRIIIFANRRISRGEELAYDYKFEVEDDQHKIPCLCGAPNCQQWMN